MSEAGVDSAAGWIYYTASPDNATQLYLYRTRLAGRDRPERITPRDQPGYHTYKISKDGRWAFHTWSSFGTPPVVETWNPGNRIEVLPAAAGRLLVRVTVTVAP